MPLKAHASSAVGAKNRYDLRANVRVPTRVRASKHADANGGGVF